MKERVDLSSKELCRPEVTYLNEGCEGDRGRS